MPVGLEDVGDLILLGERFDQVDHPRRQEHVEDRFLGDEAPEAAWRMEAFFRSNFVEHKDPVSSIQNDFLFVAKMEV